jgi:hypothetical protein
MTRFVRCVATFCTAFLLFSTAGGAEQGPPTEYQVKAAFLYNFTSFVEWPESAFTSPTQPLVITILGADPFGALLDDLVRGKTVNGHNIMINRVAELSDVYGSHMIYVGADERKHAAAVWAACRNQPILTIADMDVSDGRPAIVCMSVGGDNRLKLKINMTAAERSGLKISSRLLRLAEIVRE